MSATINIFDNPIEKKYRTLEVETPCKVGDHCKGFKNEYSLVYVNGELRDLDTELKDGDLCGVQQYASGSAGDFFMEVLVPGYHIFKPALKWMGKKLVKWLIGKPDSGTEEESESGEKTPTIGGCKNSSSRNKTIPLILGKTLMTPYLIGDPYTTIDTSSDKGQHYFHALYIVGYNKLQIRDIALGNNIIAPNDGSGGCVSQSDYTTAQTSDLESGFPAVKKTGAFYPPASYQPKIEIQQGANEVSLYPQKVVQEEFGDCISTSGGQPNFSSGYRFFSARYPHKVEVEIQMPNGLIAYKEGKKKDHMVTIRLAMSRDGGATWEPFAYFNRASSTATDSSGNSCSTFKRKNKDEMNFVASRTFTYNEVKNCTNNVIEFRIWAWWSHEDSSKWQYIDDVCISAVRTWVYDPDASKSANTIVVERPMVASRRNRTARIGLQIMATDDIQNTIDQLNCICTSKARTWNGSSWSTAVSTTNNPASLLLLAMQGVCRGNRTYPDSRIDLASLGAFYEWCADTSKVGDGLPRFHCNGAVLNRTKTIDLLRQIASCGRGSLGINGDKYCIEIDSPRSTKVMVLNEQNILAHNSHKDFDELPDGFECRFVNALNYYQEDSLVVWFNTTKPVEDRSTETVEYPFLTDAKRVVRQAWYDYACRKLRPETWDIKVATEGNLINPGDLVEIQGSSISVGIGEGAEITSLLTEGNYITGIVTDGSFNVSDLTNDYGVRIVCTGSYGNPAIINKRVVFNQVGIHRTLNFETPVSLDAVNQPCIGDIVSFGLYQSETLDALCVGKKDNGDGTFNLSFCPYQEGIYTAESGKVPEYDSKITKPSVAGLPINKDYATIDDVNSALEYAMDGDEDTIPPDVTAVTAIASEHGIELSCVCGRSYLTESISFKYQIKRGSGAEWVDIQPSGGGYQFNRNVDGYPEAGTLNTWGIRAKAVNSYGNESENWTTGIINTDSYGTWKVRPPVITERTNKRSLHLHMEQPESNKQIYGNIRYQVQISRADDIENGVRQWYKPDLSSASDPYGDNELCYKVDTDPAPDPAYVVATDDFSQTVPLQGQSATPAAPSDTVYYYRVLAFNEAGCAMHEVEGVSVPYYAETNQMTARATGARDVVLAHMNDGTQHPDALTAKNIYAENLTAIVGTFSQMQGDVETSDNFWKGMDTNNPEFRVGNDHNLEEQDDEDAEFIHYKDGSLAMKLKNFIVTVAETTIKGTLTLYNAAKTFRNLVSSAGMRFQKKVTDWLNPVDVAQISADSDSNLTITNNPAALADYQIAPPSNSIKIHHLDTSLNDTDGNNTENLVAASGGCGATAEPILERLTSYFAGKLKKAGVVTKSAPAYNQQAWTQSGFVILGVCNGIVAGYTVSGDVYTCKTYNAATGDLLTSFDITFGSKVTNRKVKAFWVKTPAFGWEFVFGSSYYAVIPQVYSEYFWYFYHQDGTGIWGAPDAGADLGCAYNYSKDSFVAFATGISGKTLTVQTVDLSGRGRATYSYTINNQYVTELIAGQVAGGMIMLKFNNTNLPSHPWLYIVPWNCTGDINTNIYEELYFVDSWTDYGSDNGYFHLLNESGTRYLFPNTSLMNPVTINSDYFPIRNGADNDTVYLYKPGDNSIYALANGTYSKIGTTVASSSYLARFDNNKKYYAVGNSLYYYPSYCQVLVAEKHYAFWFKGNAIKFGKLSIPTDPARWLYCRLTASGSTVSYYIVRDTLVNGALDVFANSSKSLATYSWEEDNNDLDFTLEGSVEEFTSDAADISSAVMLSMVQYKLPYGAPGSSGNLPGSDKFILLAKDPNKVTSNVIGAAQVLNANDAVTLSAGANPGARLVFITTGACTITYTGILGAQVTDSLGANVQVEYTWNGNAWLCTSAPPIGRIIEQKPDEPTPAAMYGGQWQEHNYGGVFFRSKGGDSCGFHAAFRVSSWGSGTSVTLVDTPVDGNGTTITSSNCANYIIVAGNSYSKISSVSGKTLTLSSAISGYANITEVIIGQGEGVPNIVGQMAGVYNSYTSRDKEEYKGAFAPTTYGFNNNEPIAAPCSTSYGSRTWFNAAYGEIHSGTYYNNVYGKSDHVTSLNIALRYWRRFQ